MTYRDSRTKPLNMRVGTEVHQLLYEKLCEVNPNTSHVPAHNIRFYDPYLADYDVYSFAFGLLIALQYQWYSRLIS